MNNNKELKSRRFKHSVIRKIIVFFEIIALVLVGTGSFLYAKLNQINIEDLNFSEVGMNEGVDDTTYTGYTNIALFGLDSRDGGLGKGNRSDTMIIASINNDTGKVNMVSLFRDTYLDVGGWYTKANAAYSYGGPEGALTMLNKTFDLNITQYVAADFGALTVAIDAVGGLDVEMTGEEIFWMNGYIAETSEASGIWSSTLDVPLVDGTYHLNGTQATAFCRIRYTEGYDYKRTERQRYVLELLFEKAKTLSFKELNKIADEVFPKFQTNLKITDIVKLASRASKLEMGESIGFPYNKTSGYVRNSGSCVICTDLKGDVVRLHKELFGTENYIVSSDLSYLSNQVSNVETYTPTESEVEAAESDPDYYNNLEDAAYSEQLNSEKSDGDDLSAGSDDSLDSKNSETINDNMEADKSENSESSSSDSTVNENSTSGDNSPTDNNEINNSTTTKVTEDAE